MKKVTWGLISIFALWCMIETALIIWGLPFVNASPRSEFFQKVVLVVCSTLMITIAAALFIHISNHMFYMIEKYGKGKLSC